MIIAVETFWPETFGGWLGIMVAVVIIASGVAGMIRYMQHTTLVAIKGELVGIRKAQATNIASTLTAITRVEALEVTINNGLTHKTQATSDEVTKLREAQVHIRTDIAEMIGLLKGKDI